MHVGKNRSSFGTRRQNPGLLCGTLQLPAAAAVLPWFTDRVFDCAPFWPRLREKYRRCLGPKCATAAGTSSRLHLSAASLLRYGPGGALAFCIAFFFCKLFDANNTPDRKVYLRNVCNQVSVASFSHAASRKFVLCPHVWRTCLY